MATLTATVTRDLQAYQSRDLGPQVHSIMAILPQCSEEKACDALIHAGEDIEGAIELLLTSMDASPKKKVPQQPAVVPQQVMSQVPIQQMEEEVEQVIVQQPKSPVTQVKPVEPEPVVVEQPAPPEEEVFDPQPNVPEMSYFLNMVKRDRAPTTAEKHLLKLRKKMREIEMIEKKLASNEKVDALQLPKLEKKGDLTIELEGYETAVNKTLVEEAEALRKQHIEEEWTRIEAEKAERRRIEEERREAERIRIEEERKRKEEEERQRHEEEQARLKAEAEAAEAKRQLEAAARLEQERKREAEDQRRKQEQEEALQRQRRAGAAGDWAGVASGPVYNSGYTAGKKGPNFGYKGKGAEQPVEQQSYAPPQTYESKKGVQQPVGYGQHQMEHAYNGAQPDQGGYTQDVGGDPSDDWGATASAEIMEQQKMALRDSGREQQGAFDGSSGMVDGGKGMDGKNIRSMMAWNYDKGSMMDGNWRDQRTNYQGGYQQKGSDGKKGGNKGKGKGKPKGYNNRGPALGSQF
ncbi:unnamed protein product [Amoebophrya sp. A25]|nr:unnamed protein product [Amoebophrya sp. A25]|eukprot:GSA25T00011705001.1